MQFFEQRTRMQTLKTILEENFTSLIKNKNNLQVDRYVQENAYFLAL